ncbi:Protein of unknown function [Lishizhenia tianjinensis]|uniref:DUF1573 domain-containing protein n=1 Tax=Lishizhenia tianjinensis TaxID=477690 RepID=A0A1I6YGX5_9FLAO|nr:DUF1573 domain-containing protein [Lishizhenia tianjinensis]SFT49494.1 Protein of unknown function [Lishizhenia tianjinensis]
MKGKFLFLAMLFILASCGSENTSMIGEKTTMEVQEVVDMGDVARGEVIEAEISIKNTGDVPLIIADVKESCSCTVTDKPSDPIAPGESTSTVAKIDTKNFSPGTFTKTVTISGNTKPSGHTVLIKANVIN